MVDILLMCIAAVGILGAIACGFGMEDEPGLFFAALFLAVIVGLDIWWLSAAWFQLQTYPTLLVESFPVQTITSDDGSKYQIYIDYGDGTINNVTSRWNRIVPDGTMVVRLERQGRWAKGIRFFMASKTRDELRLPLDCRWDGFLEEETEDGN